MTEDFVASAKWLTARPEGNGRLGAIGFCFGGGIVNTLAVRLPELSAAVPFYGAPPADRRRSRDQGRGARPPGRTRYPAGLNVAGYNAELTAANVRHDGYIYAGANHGFYNDTTPRYDATASTLAWSRTTAWFAKYLPRLAPRQPLRDRLEGGVAELPQQEAILVGEQRVALCAR